MQDSLIARCADMWALGMTSAGVGEEAADGRAAVQEAEAAEGTVRGAGAARRAAQAAGSQLPTAAYSLAAAKVPMAKAAGKHHGRLATGRTTLWR